MKALGIVRKIDELGRICVPIELRRTLDIDEKDGVEIFVDGDMIILKKYQPSCIFCGDYKEVTHFKGKLICSSCSESIRGGK